ASAVPGADFLMARAASDLAARLSTVERHFTKAATLFSLTGHAAQTLAESGKVGTVTRVEADPAFLAGGEGLVVAPDTVPFDPASLDLAVSLLTLQEANDIP